MQHQAIAVILGLAIGLATAGARAQDPSREQLEEWFNAPPEKSAASVNEGELVFLTRLPGKPVHHHQNALVIRETSLDDGWTELTQCHENLDAVPAAQILFHRTRTTGLHIISQSGIVDAWVEGNTVQLRDIFPGAKLCIGAFSQALHDNGDGSYSLRNGPFMRKFLDGYYPMRVSMTVRLEGLALRFEGMLPAAQEGLKVSKNGREVSFDAWFEGRLVTEMRFSTRSP